MSSRLYFVGRAVSRENDGKLFAAISSAEPSCRLLIRHCRTMPNSGSWLPLSSPLSLRPADIDEFTLSLKGVFDDQLPVLFVYDDEPEAV